MSFRRKAAVYSKGSQVAPPSRTMDNYQTLQTAIWRHQYTASTPDVGTPSVLPPNEYFITVLSRFRRSFDAAIADTPPTPTASNNYQSTDAFNGSRIDNMDAIIRLKNSSSIVEATVDIYQLSLSFYDALIWNTIRTANSPVTFATASATNNGTVDEKAMAATIILDNDWNNFKFQQHYLKKLGTVTIPNQDNDNIAEIRVKDIPAKCRRSQTGMYYALLFANDSNKNAAATLNLDYSFSNSFDEFPSENRLPFID